MKSWFEKQVHCDIFELADRKPTLIAEVTIMEKREYYPECSQSDLPYEDYTNKEKSLDILKTTAEHM